MRKERNTAIVLLLTLILITLVILCVLLLSNRLEITGNNGQVEEETVATENIDEIGKKAAEKWSEIGYSFIEPLYFTDLSKLSQKQLRELYSAYLFCHDLFDSRVTEEYAGDELRFWTAKEGIEQFSKDYFGVSFDHMTPDPDAVIGDQVEFYFNARFQVMDSDNNSFTYLDCTKNEDGTYQLTLQANTDYPLTDEYHVITNHSIRFAYDAGEIYFLYAQVKETARNSEPEVFSLQGKNETNLSVTALKQEDMEYAPYISQLTWLLTSDDWVPSEIAPTDYVMWYGYHVKTRGSVEAYRREGEDGLFFPQEEFEREIQKYFDVSTEHLRSDSEIYLADRKVYHTPAALYILSKKECIIKKVTDEDEKIEILFSLFYPESGNCSEIVLSIKKEKDGFSYLSYVHK